MSLSHLSQIKWPVYYALSYHRRAERAGVWAQVNVHESLLLSGEMWHRWMRRERNITASSFIQIFFSSRNSTFRKCRRGGQCTPLWSLCDVIVKPLDSQLLEVMWVMQNPRTLRTQVYMYSICIFLKCAGIDIIYNITKQMNKLIFYMRDSYMKNSICPVWCDEDCMRCLFNLWENVRQLTYLTFWCIINPRWPRNSEAGFRLATWRLHNWSTPFRSVVFVLCCGGAKIIFIVLLKQVGNAKKPSVFSAFLLNSMLMMRKATQKSIQELILE